MAGKVRDMALRMSSYPHVHEFMRKWVDCADNWRSSTSLPSGADQAGDDAGEDGSTGTLSQSQLPATRPDLTLLFPSNFPCACLHRRDGGRIENARGNGIEECIRYVQY